MFSFSRSWGLLCHLQIYLCQRLQILLKETNRFSFISLAKTTKIIKNEKNKKKKIQSTLTQQQIS